MTKPQKCGGELVENFFNLWKTGVSATSDPCPDMLGVFLGNLRVDEDVI